MIGGQSVVLSLAGARIAIGDTLLIRALTLDARAGDVWAVLGANGAGKSTLLRTLAGLHRAQSGTIALNERAIGDWPADEAARIRGFLPQFSHDAFSTPVRDIVLMGRHPHLARWQWESADDVAAANAALAAMNVAELAERDVTTLSGGERQRVAIAALLAQDPKLLLLDEPSAHLDWHQQVVVLDVLARLARERGKLVVLSLHDPNLARRFATHAVILLPDRTARSGPCDALLDAPTLSTAYGHPVLALEAASGRIFVPQ